MRRDLRFFVSVIFALLFVIIGICFVAALNPPSNLRFENNVTTVYDEGTFSINWTSGGGTVKNYSIYVSNDGGNTFINKFFNDSNTGLSFSSTIHANYTFKVGSSQGNQGMDEVNQTQKISIFIDTTAPTITLSGYTNATPKKNTEQLTLNVFVVDADSGTGTACVIQINGVNHTFTLSSGWCNNSAVDLTGLSDGDKKINIWAKDIVNNFGLDNSFVVKVDTTAPTATASCSPGTVKIGDDFPCTCSGTDATSGVNTREGSSTSGSNSTSNIGTFDYTCVVTDFAGNTGSAIVTYSVVEFLNDSEIVNSTVTSSSENNEEITESQQETEEPEIPPIIGESAKASEKIKKERVKWFLIAVTVAALVIVVFVLFWLRIIKKQTPEFD